MTMMKRPSPLRPASSSDDDDEEQLEDLVVVVKENMKDEEAEEEKKKEEEDENKEEEDDESIFTVKKKHVVISTTPAQPPQSSSSPMGEEEEEEEESNYQSARSDSDLPPPPPPPENTTKSSPNNITDVKKPITSIPMFPLSAKRVHEAADNKPMEGEVSKRRRKNQKKNGDGEVSQRRSSSNKLWSKADEAVILKGLLCLINKHGAGKPISELINNLHQNIKGLLEVEVTNTQLYGKIRKLKQKYLISTINDPKLDELAKKIWGTSEKEVDFKVREEEEEMTDEQAINGGVNSTAPVKKPSSISNFFRNDKLLSSEQSLPLPSFFKEIIESGKNSIAPPEGLKSFLMKEALGFIGSSKAKDLEKKWNKLQIAEAKIYLDRIDLVKEQAELVLDAFSTEE